MKKTFYFILISFFSFIQAENTTTPFVSSEIFLNESAKEPVDEKNLTEISLKVEHKKYGIYIIPSWNRLIPAGASFRHFINDMDFFEIAFCNMKSGTLHITYMDSGISEEVGSIHKNTLNASYGFRKINRYLSPYVSFGAGLYIPSVEMYKFSSMESFPIVSSNVGFEFGLGFLDFGTSYVLSDWVDKFSGLDSFFRSDDLPNLLFELRLGVQLLY